MQIGEKIKSLRRSKLMTQSELAGSRITRNMLSAIEHGTALPSLPTVLYLAERLNVPAGYLLADESDELAYRKMTAIGNIRAAMSEKDWSGTLALLNAVCAGKTDDELSYIRARCEFGMARDLLEQGHLRLAAAAFDRALLAAADTVYDTAWLRESAAVAFRYLSGVSATISSDVLDVDEIERARAAGDAFCEYVLALEDEQDDKEIAAYAKRYPNSLYTARLQALALMRAGDYAAAQTALETLLSREELTFGVLLYEVFGDLEVCYRKNDDYKRAYEFSASRLGVLERLLEEI